MSDGDEPCGCQTRTTDNGTVLTLLCSAHEAISDVELGLS